VGRNGDRLAIDSPGRHGDRKRDDLHDRPCQYGYYESAPAPGTLSTFPLSQFGMDYPVYSSPSQTTLIETTPGVISLGTYGSSNFSYIAVNGSPRLTVAAANTAYVGSTETSGALDYRFRVVNDADPNLAAHITVGLSGVGSISGSAASPPSAYAYDNGAHVTAQLGVNYVYNEEAEAEFSHYCVIATGACQDSNSSTSNVTVQYGAAASTYSGGFTLTEQPLALISGEIYTVSMAISLGLSDGSAYATVDPTFTLPAGYSLELSPGVSNGAVPEPAAWALMLVGVGGVGALARHRRSGALAAA
jgi:hypothetical protein